MSKSTLVPILSVSVFLTGACGGDAPTGLSQSDLAGDYQATTFTVTEDGSTTDVLAEGGSLEITLAADGTSSGTFVIPASFTESGEEEQASMAGTWSVSAGTVTFDQPADTFVRDMAFSVVSGRLEGEETFGDETLRVVLTRT